MICGLLVLLIGAYDDLRGANATIKFLSLGCVTTLFYALGGRIEGLSIPLVGQVTLHPVVGFALTLVWVVGITNAFNLIDGVDGLATQRLGEKLRRTDQPRDEAAQEDRDRGAGQEAAGDPLGDAA